MHDQAEAAAIALVEETEEALTPVELTSEVRRALAKVHEVHAQSLIGTRTAEARRHVETGLALLGDEASAEADNERAWLWMEACEPAGIDAIAVDALHELSNRNTLKPPVIVWIGIRTAELWKRRGDLARAIERLDRASAVTSLDRNSERVILDAKGRAARLAGRLDEAEALHRAAIEVFRTSSNGPAPGELELAICAHLRGDLATARERARGLLDDPHLGPPARRVMLDCELDEGRVAPALRGFRAMVEEAIPVRHDRPLHDCARAYVDALVRARDAAALLEGDVAMADAVLSSAESVAVGIAGDDLAWYRVLFPAMHGEALGLAEELTDVGQVILRGAWKRATNEWPDAAPRLARTLAHALLRVAARSPSGGARELEEASRVIDDALPRAATMRHLREHAHLLAARIVILARTSRDAEAIGAATRELRGSLAETGAPRIAGDVLLDLARCLPASAIDPDPLLLLDEAASLFAAMPMPARQARCLEAAGDVLASRGAPEGADARYAEAEALLERHQLRLHLPELAKKRGHEHPRGSRPEPVMASGSGSPRT